jgi:hypothetical protein
MSRDASLWAFVLGTVPVCRPFMPGAMIHTAQRNPHSYIFVTKTAIRLILRLFNNTDQLRKYGACQLKWCVQGTYDLHNMGT